MGTYVYQDINKVGREEKEDISRHTSYDKIYTASYNLCNNIIFD